MRTLPPTLPQLYHNPGRSVGREVYRNNADFTTAFTTVERSLRRISLKRSGKFADHLFFLFKKKEFFLEDAGDARDAV